jgi:hypothetical protein
MIFPGILHEVSQLLHFALENIVLVTLDLVPVASSVHRQDSVELLLHVNDTQSNLHSMQTLPYVDGASLIDQQALCVVSCCGQTDSPLASS